MSNLIGQKIKQYQIRSLIGEGGMASVYRAYDTSVKREIALKIIHPHLGRQTQFQQRFLREAQVTSRLYHPSIIGLYQFGADRSYLFMAMEFLPAGSLGAYLQRLKEKDQSNKLRESFLLAAQIADALAYAHRYNVVHGDVKPDNVLLKVLQQPDRKDEPPLRAVLTDFGLATLLESSDDTAAHSFMGSLPYMSPEQCMAKKLDGRSDIYSLGILLYRLVTGELPFDVKLPTDALMKHLNEMPTPPSQLRSDLSAEAEAAILKTLAKRPEDRFQSASELSAVLRHIAASLLPPDTAIPQRNGEGIHTQLEAFTWVGAPSQMSIEQTWADDFDRLLIARSGEPPVVRAMDKDLLTVGRDKNSEVVLDAASVSRRHVRLEQTATGWQVVDLGSTNKTLLEGNRLLPDVREVWQPTQTLQIGPFYLQWKASKKRASEAAFKPVEQDSTPQANIPVAEIHRADELSAVVTPTELSVLPGEQAEQEIALLNQGALVKHYYVKVTGLPDNWVVVPLEGKHLMPGERGALKITLQPPRESSSKADIYPYQLGIVEEGSEQPALSVECRLTVNPFGGFVMDMQPKSIEGKGVCHILITNQGNFEAVYTVIGRDPGEAVRFRPVQAENKVEPPAEARYKSPGLGIIYTQITIPPGEQGTAKLQVSPRRRPLTGRLQTFPFEVQVGTAEADPQSLPGQLEVKPLLPPWVLPLLAALLLLCLGAAALWSLLGGDGAAGTETPSPAAQVDGAGDSAGGEDEASAGGADQAGETPGADGAETSGTPPVVAETAVLTDTAAAGSGNEISVINNNNVIVVVGPCGLSDGQIQAIIANTATPTASASGTPAPTATPSANTLVITTCSYTIPLAATAQPTHTPAPTATATPSPTVNPPPVANADTYTTAEDAPLNGASLLNNDSDTIGGPLTAVLDSSPSNGTLSLNANGTFLYTPRNNFSGTDVFTYHTSDGNKNSATATVLITVNAANDAPVATDDRFSTAEDTALNNSTFNVLGNDSDVDSPILNVFLDNPPENGTVTLNNGGTFLYTPNLNFFGSDTFTYHASDGVNNSNVTTVIITVGGVNDAPVATADSFNTSQGTTLNGSVLLNDYDVDSGALTAVLEDPSDNGSLTLNPDGTFVYTPNTNFSGSDSFTYHADDGTAVSPPTQVTITVAPGATQLAFASTINGNFEIYRINADGSGLLNLTNNGAEESLFAWSPDGERIAFVSNRNDLDSLFVMNADGSNQVPLTTNFNVLDLFWSPDGGQITFAAATGEGNSQIFVINANGGAPFPLTDGSFDDLAPVWSPDGGRIAFVRGSFEEEDVEIFAVNPDGSNLVNLSNNDGDDSDPAWSPDGGRLLFTSTVFNATGGIARDIFVMNRDGSGQVNLTNNPAEDELPRWSPNGSQLAFLSNRDGLSEIYRLNGDGSGLLRLTNNSLSETDFDWSLDGTQLAITADDSGLYLVNADGSGFLPLHQSPIPYQNPRWRP